VTRRAAGSVFLLTDYGSADEFAGVVRAVVQRNAPGAPVVDITHEVAPFDVRAGALALCRAAPHLGPGVVVAVVDPGVGTSRRAVAVRAAFPVPTRLVPPGTEPGTLDFVGPDNGLLPWAIDAVGGAGPAVRLPGRPAGAGGATFDGRDIFAPAAARLWRGEPLADLGDDLDPGTLERLAPPRLAVAPGVLEAEVQWVDRFGNVQLAARPADARHAGLGAEVVVTVAGVTHRARTVDTFAAVEPAALGLVTDANGHLSLVCNRRSAATVLGVGPGDVVTVRGTQDGAP
jgi:hypothetical protein